ncbi:MAG: alpha glucosidase [Gammaproteobacteria bacterium]|nr:alpha glucosidase [Gammaproteobacteria bacterium]
MSKISEPLWWQGAVIYQIYPRSFFDSNDDGVGDLNGITEKLSYVAELGVDAIWISPFLKSPQADFGYDVSDYYQIDPLFGDIAAFDTLIQKAHQLGLRVLMDMVLNHTSDQHPWFQESRQNAHNPKANWYVWADPKADGSPPNNWLSVFGGKAWEWDESRKQYYLHNFLASQPDLNFHEPQVVEALLAATEFWLQRGVDGFRLDTANFYTHDVALRDNPLRADHEPPAEGVPPQNPYARQHHVYDKSRPENFIFLKKIRALINRYPHATTLGEVGDNIATAASYVQGHEHLHMVYNFRLLDISSDFSPRLMCDVIKELECHIADGWPCWSFSNHDVARTATRFGRGESHDALSKVLLALLFSLRGTVCLYQGEELGLAEAEVPFEKMRDPYGIRFYPEFKGRDGCRTPMPWTSEGGFSQAEPWLPMSEAHLPCAVSVQQENQHSVLSLCQTFLRWRKQQSALCYGDIRLLSVTENLLCFERVWQNQTILAVFNLGEYAQALPAEVKAYAVPLFGHGFETEKDCVLGYGALFFERE